MTSSAKKLDLETSRRLGIYWRLIHLSVCRYGSHPTGQLLTAYTMDLLIEAGYEPTISDLCRATGLPKSTISRYVSWQIHHGYAREVIDPHDRRVRRLQQTKKGRSEMARTKKDLAEAFSHADEVIDRITSGAVADPEAILMRMEKLTQHYSRHWP